MIDAFAVKPSRRGRRFSFPLLLILLSGTSLVWGQSDSFSNRTAILHGANIIEQFDLATLEAGEPLHGDYRGEGGSVWWQWQAEESFPSTIYAASTEKDETEMVIAVYSGGTLDTLTLEALSLPSKYPFIHWLPEIGKVYHIVISHTSSAAPGSVTLHFHAGGAPAHDAFSNAIPIDLQSHKNLDGVLGRATVEDGESVSESLEEGTVWYRVEPHQSGQLTIWTDGVSDSVHANGPSGPPDFGPSYTVTQDEPVYLRLIYSTDRQDYTRFSLRLSFAATPPNDFQENASLIEKAAIGTLQGATADEGFGREHDVWWQWVAGESGLHCVSFSKNRRLRAEVYWEVRDEPNARVSVAPASAQPVFEAVEGRSYLIRVTGVSSHNQFVIDVTKVVVADRTHAIESASELLLESGKNVAILAEPSPDGETWWKWTVPADGELQIWDPHAYWRERIRLYDRQGDGSFLERSLDRIFDSLESFRVLKDRTLAFQLRPSAGEDRVFFNAAFHETWPNETQKTALDLDFLLQRPWVDLGFEKDTGRSSWWTWETTGKGLLYFTVLELDEDSHFSFTSIHHNDRVISGSPFAVEENQLLSFRVHSPGAFAFEVETIPQLPNDRLKDAVDLSWTNSARLRMRQRGATEEEGTNHGERAWWRWTAPAHPVVVESTGARFLVPNGNGWLTSPSELRNNDRMIPQPGQTYYLGKQDSDDLSSLELLVREPLPNDDFANAIVLGAEQEMEVKGSLRGSLDGKGWWRWHSPDVPVYVDLSVEDWRPDRLGVYRGAEEDSLERVAESSGTPLSFLAEPLETYHFKINSSEFESPAFILHRSHREKIANDAFSAAQTVALTGRKKIEVDLIGTTVAEGEPGSQATHSAWWQWEPDAAVDFSVDLIGGDRSGVDVFVGNDVEALQQLPMGDEPWRLQRGQYVYVRAFDQPFSSPTLKAIPVTLDLWRHPPPANDHFSQRTELGTVELASIVISTLSMTPEDLDPEEMKDGMLGNVWWEWEAPSNAVMVLSLSDDPEGVLGVFAGQSHATLKPINTGREALQFSVREGERYVIGYASAETRDDITLELNKAVTLANDRFASPMELQGREVTIETSNLGATLDPDEPPVWSEASRNSVWWEWKTDRAARYQVMLPQGFEFAVLQQDAGGAWEAASVEHESPYWSFYVDAERTYRLGANSSSADAQAFEFKILYHDRPANDDFENALAIHGLSVTVDGQNFGATNEEDEWDRLNFPAGRGNSHSVWYQWQAPLSGLVSINFTDPLTITILTESLFSLRKVATFNWDSRPQSFRVDAGKTYYLAVWGRAPSVFTWRLDYSRLINHELNDATWIAPPPNDLFADAFDMGRRLPVRSSGSLAKALLEKGEPQRIDDLRDGASVWWRWQALTDEYVQVNLRRRHALPIELIVYEGDALSHLTEVVRTSSNTTGFMAFPDQFYHFAVAGDFSGIEKSEPAQFMMELGLQAGALRSVGTDAFASRVNLGEQDHLRVEASSQFATREVGEPDHVPGQAPKHTLWWTWRPSTSLNYLFETDGDHTLTVYAGESLEALTQVGSATGKEILPLQEGVPYQLAIDGPPGEVAFEVTPITLPTNDSFSEALPFSLGEREILFTGASREPNEEHLLHSNYEGGSLWWRWVSTVTGPVAVSTMGSEHSTYVGVYQGSAVDDLQMLTNNRSTDQPRFRAIKGEVYHIALISKEAGITARTKLALAALGTPPVNDDFEYATAVISSRNIAITSDTSLATIEPEETLPDIPTADRLEASVWWKWQATSTRPYTLSVEFDSHRNGYLHILNEAMDPVIAGEWTARPAYFQADAGKSYWISISTDAYNHGPLAWQLTPGVVLENDLFEDRVDLGSSTEVSFEGTTVGATRLDGEETLIQRRIEDIGSVWWKWKAPSDGSVRLTFDDPFAALFRFYREEADGVIGETVFTSDRVPPRMDWFEVEKDGVYAIMIEASPANFTAHLKLEKAADLNSSFERRWDLGNDASVNSEAHLIGDAEDQSYWWEWQAPGTGLAKLTIHSDAHVEVIFWKDGENGLEEVSRDSRIVAVSEGDRLFLQLIGSYTSFSFKLDFESQSEPVTYRELRNRFFENAYPVRGELVNVYGSTLNRSRGWGEPKLFALNAYEDQSAWFQWEAPRDGLVRLTVSSEDRRPVAGVYQGGDRLSLQPVIIHGHGAGFFTKPEFEAQEGVIYHMALFNVNERYHFSLEMAPPNRAFHSAEDLGRAQSVDGSASMRLATMEAGAPLLSFSNSPFPSNQLWWQWRAPENGNVSWSESSTHSGRRGVGAFTGNTLTALTELAIGEEAVRFPVIGGEQIFLAIDSRSQLEPIHYALRFHPQEPGEATGFAQWLGRHFQGRPTADQALDADPDGDGRANWEEYVFAGHPLIRKASDPIAITKNSALPAGTAVLSHPWPSDSVGVSLHYEVSNDLQDWTTLEEGIDYIASSQADPSLEPTHHRQRVEIKNVTTTQFVRLVATFQP